MSVLRTRVIGLRAVRTGEGLSEFIKQWSVSNESEELADGDAKSKQAAQHRPMVAERVNSLKAIPSAELSAAGLHQDLESSDDAVRKFKEWEDTFISPCRVLVQRCEEAG